ncbi:MAG: preprotein translocase subunit SecY [Acidobacteria bacterium RIFCSPLOWO2_02_FULL_59_13]|nr:MAG: preprotein translocase subunit SecY [Acidobacteria bacterium RIFCSPLOWO2_02_FULL_59_13]
MKTIRNILSIPELRNRILFTLGILAIFRLGGHIPTPGINADLLQQFFEENRGTVFGFVDIFSGGNFRRLTVFALGIMPYITASIILQLLTPVWPYLDRLHKEGEMGRQKITKYTRYLTVVLSAFQAFGIALTLQRQAFQGTSFVINPGPMFLVTTVLTLTTGSVFVMWLGEQITQRGIGEGMSLLIFAGIVVGLPRAIIELYEKVFVTGEWNHVQLGMLLVLMLLAVAFIVLVERGERRVNVQYATRVMGRRSVGGQTTHLPIRVNAGGVMPVIFASSILTFPQTIALMGGDNPRWQGVFQALAWGEPLYTLLYVMGIIFFAYFYVSIVFNPNDVADNIRRHGGFVPGIRPGKNTAEHFNTILTRLTLVGGCYLALVSLVPEFMISGIHLHHLPWVGGWIDEQFPRFLLDGLGVSFYFGGTSLLICVGVAMDTVSKVEAHLLMRHYEGLVPGAGRIRGRRG